VLQKSLNCHQQRRTQACQVSECLRRPQRCILSTIRHTLYLNWPKSVDGARAYLSARGAILKSHFDRHTDQCPSPLQSSGMTCKPHLRIQLCWTLCSVRVIILALQSYQKEYSTFSDFEHSTTKIVLGRAEAGIPLRCQPKTQTTWHSVYWRWLRVVHVSIKYQHFR
jgi:hypothetical protein